MEAMLLQSSNSDSNHHHHQSISVNRNRFIQNPNNFITRSSSENFSPYPNIHGGGGGSTFYSAPSFYTSSVPIINQKQPPLLPLPKPYASLPLIPIRPNNTNNNRPHLPLIPSSPIRKNNNRSSSTRDHTDRNNLYTSKKKSKSSSVISLKKQIQSFTTVKGGDVNLMISSKRLGPEPCDIPKQVSRVMKQQRKPTAVKVMDVDEEFSGSIFALAPPPSSLPLPKFSMRPRMLKPLDVPGSDNLCRMLRLR